MIKINDKTKCCGCGACYNICFKNAISMEYDNEGFFYPFVDDNKCVKCELCLKVCPVTEVKDNRQTQNTVLEVYGAKNKNVEEQEKSSSGGMFSLFANYILENNGIVFGASFNDKWQVIHKFIDKKEDLDDLRRSKYVQSNIGNTYKQASEFLQKDKYVLFCGTPCQVAGLKGFLQKDYEKLYCIDIICHGVPSPKVWDKFLQQNYNIDDIESINFRNKDFAWDKFYLKILRTNETKINFFYKLFIQVFDKKNFLVAHYYYNYYLRGFLSNLFLRPICHDCCFKGNRKLCDITIYDLWGIKNIIPQLYDKNGVSGININSLKGKYLFEQIKNNLKFTTIDFSKMIKYNPPFLTSVKPHPKRQEFFDNYQTEPLNNLINRLLHRPFLKRCFNFLRNRLRK